MTTWLGYTDQNGTVGYGSIDFGPKDMCSAILTYNSCPAGIKP